MESINQQVWKALQTDTAVMRGMERDLINIRALAKEIITKYELKASLDAVISSIRRFPLEASKEEEETLRHIFRDSIVGTKNNVACITIKMQPSQVFAKICAMNLPAIRMTTGTEEVKIIVENAHADEVAKLFKKAEVEKGLSEINVTVSEKAVKTKGVLARMAGELSIANINMHELLVCPPEFLIYVSEKDIVKAHERIIALTS